MNGDQVTFEVTEEDKLISHMFLSGKFKHGEDMKNRSLYPLPNMDEIPERLKKYKSYLSYAKPKR